MTRASEPSKDDDISLRGMVDRLSAELVARGWQVAAAESCTGGWIAKVLTDPAGSSAWFDRGFVTYSNAAKQELLGVSGETLAEHGAVSAATVEAMVSGTLVHSAADVAVAVSGIAGPSGGTPDKPVGTVWFAWARRGTVPNARCALLPGERDRVRRAAVRIALEGLLEETGRSVVRR